MEPNKRIKAGMTLVESLMAITIFTIGIAGFSLLFTRSWRSNSFAFELGQSSMAVSQGMNEMIEYIRKARQGDDGSYPIKSASDNDLVIFSDYDKDGVTERLHFYKSGYQIIMGYRKPSGTLPKTYASGDEATKVIVSGGIINNASEPIFYYYNKNYPEDQVNNPLVAPVDVSSVRLVKFFLKINLVPNRAPDNVELRNFVELRNLSD